MGVGSSERAAVVEDMRFGKRILVGVDGSTNSVTALGWAVDEARALGCELEALYAWQMPAMAYSAPGYIPPSQSDIDLEGERVLTAAVAQVPGGSDVKIALRVVEGAPAQVLAAEAADPGVGLVVVGARGHGAVAGLLLGSVSHSLTHHCQKPLVIVPKGWSGGDGRIVAGVDGSPESIRALRWAVGQARLVDAPLEAVLVWSAPSPVLPPHVPAAEMDDAISARLAEAVDQVDTSGVRLSEVILDGQPARRLINRAEGASLLVVGTRGLGRAHEAISGSVSHSCSNHAATPVAVIPEPRDA
jgi:nucleotide-binding universal stress UspA family protein